MDFYFIFSQPLAQFPLWSRADARGWEQRDDGTIPCAPCPWMPLDSSAVHPKRSLLRLPPGISSPSRSWHTVVIPAPFPSRTGCPEPGLEQKMVYFRMMPLGLAGGSQDTTTLLAEDGTALIPAGGPGTEEGERGRAAARRSPRSLPSWEMRQHPAVGLAPRPQPGKQLQWWCHTSRDRSACRTPLHGWLWPPCEPQAGGLIAAQALL